MTLPWILAAAAAGLVAGPRIRTSVFSRSTESGLPPRRSCPACDQEILPGRWRWRALLPVTGRCPRCRGQLGPYLLLAELAAGLALAAPGPDGRWSRQLPSAGLQAPGGAQGDSIAGRGAGGPRQARRLGLLPRPHPGPGQPRHADRIHAPGTLAPEQPGPLTAPADYSASAA